MPKCDVTEGEAYGKINYTLETDIRVFFVMDLIKALINNPAETLGMFNK